MLSYIADTVVVAASENYAILTNNIDSTNDLLNENIDVLEKDFNLFYNLNYKLVSISINRWNAEKEKYIKNIRSGFNYKLIDDNIVIEENLSELEKVAADIFGNNYEVKWKEEKFNMNMQSLMAQAQKMQKDIMNKKEEINKQIFIGNSQGIEVTVNGKKELLSIKINEDMKNEDLEMLQDMIVVAVNDALKKVDSAIEKSMGQYGSAFNGLF